MPFFSRKLRVFQIAVPVILVLIYFSFMGRSFRRAPWYEELFWNVAVPPQKLLHVIGSGIGDIWSYYIALAGTAKENDELKEKVARLETMLVDLKEMQEENGRLRGLLSWNDKIKKEPVVARVIANDPYAEFRSILINKGAEDGIGVMMPVVGPRGLVGKVGKTAARISRVMLISDPNSAVDAFVQRSRVRALVVGGSWNVKLGSIYSLARMEYLQRTSDITEGDVVVTSGLDGVFPPGIPIGSVHDIAATEYGVFRDANVVPFEDMAGLQEVAVLK